MPTWIALQRGINVGGNNALPMAELKWVGARFTMTTHGRMQRLSPSLLGFKRAEAGHGEL